MICRFIVSHNQSEIEHGFTIIENFMVENKKNLKTRIKRKESDH